MNHQHQPDRARSAKNRLQRKAEGGFRGYPIATVAYYGPDNQFASKVAVGIVQGEEEEEDLVDLKRWFSEDKDVRLDPEINRQILRFVHRRRVKSVVITDGIIGCPHEEGKDYPKGENCPHCPYWADRDRWTGELKGEAAQPTKIVTGCAWYRADQWERLLEISVDRDRLGDSYEAWVENAEETLRSLQAQQTAGVTIEKVEVDVEEMLAWCRERGVEVDAEARAEYAADLLRRRTLGDESESF